jgi:hypothetical protein
MTRLQTMLRRQAPLSTALTVGALLLSTSACDGAPEACCAIPTPDPTTSTPTLDPTTSTPTLDPTTSTPTLDPTTSTPTLDPTTSTPEADAAKAKALVKAACSAMVEGSWWDATAKAVEYAEQAAEAGPGRRGFADNVADLLEASQGSTAEHRKRWIQLRTPVFLVCKSGNAKFPQTEFDSGVDPYGS